MDIYKELAIKIDFDKGRDIEVISVFDGVEIESKTFSRGTHFVEQLLDYITHMETGGCDVYV